MGKSTTNHIFTITLLIKTKTAKNFILLFMDLKKTYDSVPFEKLWDALEKTNINVELIKIAKVYSLDNR